MLKSTLFRVLFISLIIPLVSACDLSFGSSQNETDELRLQITLQALQMTLAAQPQTISQPDLTVQPPPANPPQPVDDGQPQPPAAGDTSNGQDQLQPVASSTCLLVGVIRNNNFPNGIELSKNDIFETYWEVTNIGSCKWDKDYSLILTSGDPITTMESIPIGQSISPGGKAQVYVRMMAGDQAGTFTSYWKVRSSTGQVFGGGSQGDSAFPISMMVLPPANVPPPPAPEPNFQITNVEWVQIPNYTGNCPVTLDTKLKLTSNSAGEAHYKLHWQDGYNMTGSTIFTTAGTQTITFSRNFSKTWLESWYVIFEMISPNQMDYGTRFPAVYCYDPHWKTVDILGTVEIKDDNPIDDAKKTFNVSKKYIFDSEHVTQYFDFDECVGGEVRVVITSSVRSNNDGSASFVGTIYLYEGTSCDRGMLRKAVSFNETILPMQTLQFYKYVLNDTDVFGGDYAKVLLNVTNYHTVY